MRDHPACWGNDTHPVTARLSQLDLDPVIMSHDRVAHTLPYCCFSHSLMDLYAHALLKGSECLPGCLVIFRGEVVAVLVLEQIQEVLYTQTSNPDCAGCLCHHALETGTTPLATSLTARPCSQRGCGKGWVRQNKGKGEELSPTSCQSTTSSSRIHTENGDS